MNAPRSRRCSRIVAETCAIPAEINNHFVLFVPLWLLLKNITRDLDSIAEALFVEDVTDVVLNRTHTNLQFGCDFFVSQTARNGDGHAVFRVSQHFILETYGSVVTFPALTNRAI